VPGGIPWIRIHSLSPCVRTIKEIGREHVRFIVRRIVQPPERPDDPLPENAMGRG
jgi:hypothetical protein